MKLARWLLPLCIAVAACGPRGVTTGAVTYPNLATALSSGRAIYVDAEAVTLTGGAGADWTPTKAPQTTGLWVGGVGNVKIDLAGGSTGVTLTAVPAGSLLSVSVTKVYNTTDGTSATSVAALY